MGDSDRVPPTARADALTTRPASTELEPLERTEPLAFPLLTESEAFDRETERVLVSAPRTGDERATLTFLTGVSAGQVVAIPPTGGVIGRAEGALVVLEDQGVSRRHARIQPTPDGFFIEDLESTNGTFVSGVRVGSRELRSGDRIQLGPSVLLRYALVDSTEEALQRRLYESSTRDALTGVYNRAFLAERLVAEVSHARRHKAELALLMLDLDDFKSVNDTLGHAAGDELLREVAWRLQGCTRGADTVCRWGGDEFIVMLPNVATIEEAELVAQKIRGCIAAPVHLGDTSLAIGISIGIALLDPGDTAIERVIRDADRAMYRAKRLARQEASRAVSSLDSPRWSVS